MQGDCVELKGLEVSKLIVVSEHKEGLSGVGVRAGRRPLSSPVDLLQGATPPSEDTEGKHAFCSSIP